jgi:hypothetical protein
MFHELKRPSPICGATDNPPDKKEGEQYYKDVMHDDRENNQICWHDEIEHGLVHKFMRASRR